jgi:hypothetical protein
MRNRSRISSTSSAENATYKPTIRKRLLIRPPLLHVRSSSLSIHLLVSLTCQYCTGRNLHQFCHNKCISYLKYNYEQARNGLPGEKLYRVCRGHRTNTKRASSVPLKGDQTNEATNHSRHSHHSRSGSTLGLSRLILRCKENY